MTQDRPARIDRRLAAILAADVAGYSWLMHRNEETAHSKLSSLIKEAVHSAMAEYSGRIVKNTGDGFLAEFPSAVAAVRAAAQFRARIRDLTMDYLEGERIRFDDAQCTGPRRYPPPSTPICEVSVGKPPESVGRGSSNSSAGA
jgi:class 3 adenylate cyclase